MPGRVFVIGVGAVGGYLAARLAQVRGDEAVVCVDADPATREAIARRGLVVEAATAVDFRAPLVTHPACVSPAEAEKMEAREGDLAVLAVKAGAAREAVLPAAGRMPVVSLQNGADPEFEEVLGDKLILGVVDFAANLKEPGLVELTADGGVILGRAAGGVDWTAREAAGLLGTGRALTVAAHENIRGVKLSKLLMNATLNPLSAATGLSYGGVFQRAFDVFKNAYLEAYRLVKTFGVPLEEVAGQHPDRFSRTLRIPGIGVLFGLVGGFKARKIYSSMHADVLAGRRTEIEFLNGYLIRQAAERGRPLPWHAAIYGVVREIEAGSLKPSPRNARLIARRAREK